jgi:hypothetical protein
VRLIRPIRRTAAVSLLLLGGTGCYHYHVAAPGFDPATEPQRQVVHSLAWGLVNKPQTALARNCANSNALDQVKVSSNLGYTLLTVVTLGFWSPVQVEWKCAKRNEDGNTGVIGAVVVQPREEGR